MPQRRRDQGPLKGDDAVSQVQWESPPETGKVMYDWEKIAKRLRSKPGEWALIFRRDRVSVANAIRQNQVKAIRLSDGFEVRTSGNDRSTSPPVCSMYLRYNPKG